MIILIFQENIEKIDYGKKGILFTFFKSKPNNPNKLLKLSMNYKNTKIKIRPDNKVFYDLQENNIVDKFILVKKLIKQFI